MFSIILMVIILQWNSQSIIAHGNELKNALNDWDKKPDIICIQETWLKEGKTYNLPGYNIYRCDRKSASKNYGGGCAIYGEKILL